MLIIEILSFAPGGKFHSGMTLMEENMLIRDICLFALIFIFVLHFAVNQLVNKKVWSRTMYFYAVLFVLYMLPGTIMATLDYGTTRANMSITAVFLAAIWIIVSPIIVRAITQHRQKKNSPPFANPDDSSNE